METWQTLRRGHRLPRLVAPAGSSAVLVGHHGGHRGRAGPPGVRAAAGTPARFSGPYRGRTFSGTTIGTVLGPSVVLLAPANFLALMSTQRRETP